ncbi:hypothetical protein F3Y22_tig00111463pilonHSYRG00113 [Hibiscus syriacus]|uniref:Uncharacterized protein n=1 Tax=Hibiscus syriacus TaxID=106335 RepID=A0A6A2YIB1_HIBSY|nr:hypothetical protein F3Y22_tig00111463pilonHSYRG00113 [Hibiscus syriacus]
MGRILEYRGSSLIQLVNPYGPKVNLGVASDISKGAPLMLLTEYGVCDYGNTPHCNCSFFSNVFQFHPSFSFSLLLSPSLPTLLSPRCNVISAKTHRHSGLLVSTSNRKYYANSFDDFQKIHCQATLYDKLQQQDLEEETGNYDGESEVKIEVPNFKMSLTELLDKSRVVPLSVYGDLKVEMTGTQQDSRELIGEDSAIASKSRGIDDSLGYKALVIVEDTNSALASLAASFYGHPSMSMCVISITGTIEMLHNGYEAVVMEASSERLSIWRCREVDFNIAVLTNFTRDHLDFHVTMDRYKKSKAKSFQRMVNPERHHKVVNIDDPNSKFFISQGNPQVPLVTFTIDNKNADVHALKVVLEWDSGLAGAPLDDIGRGIENVDAVPRRCEVINEGQPFGVNVDYAHTPDAVSSLLGFVREVEPKRIITVEILDDMLAGVGRSMQEHLKYGENDYHPPLSDGHQLYVHQNRRVAIRNAIAMCEGDMIVTAGKGHETYLIRGDEKEFFDREECRVALKLRYDK